MFGISTVRSFFYFYFFEDKEGKKIIKKQRVKILNRIYSQSGLIIRPRDRDTIRTILSLPVNLQNGL